jgi:hypothetical protein
MLARQVRVDHAERVRGVRWSTLNDAGDRAGVTAMALGRPKPAAITSMNTVTIAIMAA